MGTYTALTVAAQFVEANGIRFALGCDALGLKRVDILVRATSRRKLYRFGAARIAAVGEWDPPPAAVSLTYRTTSSRR
jgi:hypothetical protein